MALDLVLVVPVVEVLVAEVLGDTYDIMGHLSSSTLDRPDDCILDNLCVCLADVDIGTCNRTVVWLQ